MSPDTVSQIVVAAAIGIFAVIVAFNLGRLDKSKPTQCEQLSYSTPFKGTLP